jgi:hypothetical protein
MSERAARVAADLHRYVAENMLPCGCQPARGDGCTDCPPADAYARGRADAVRDVVEALRKLAEQQGQGWTIHLATDHIEKWFGAASSSDTESEDDDGRA